MVNPNDIINQQRRKVAELERQLEIARSELLGMERLAVAFGSLSASLEDLKPTGLVSVKRSRSYGTVGRAGRQPGAITKRWRSIFEIMAAENWVDVDRVTRIVRDVEGRAIRAAEVRRLFETYISHGYLEETDGMYRVSNQAIEKFGLMAAPHPPAAKATPQENEPPHFLDGFVEEGGGSDTAQDAQ